MGPRVQEAPRTGIGTPLGREDYKGGNICTHVTRSEALTNLGPLYRPFVLILFL